MPIKVLLLCLLSFSFHVDAQSGESTSDLEKELDLDDLADDTEVSTTEKTKSATSTKEAPSKNVDKATNKKADETADTKSKSKTITRDTTKVDFDSATIEGERKLPQNMFLSGQIKQDFNQMINLRKNFRNELRNSGAAVRALVK